MERCMNKEMLRFVYMLEVDNRGSKSFYFGNNHIFYIGQTKDLKRRMQEHLRGVNSKFLNTCFRDARKKLVFVKYVFGTEFDSLIEERLLKKLSKSKKCDLVGCSDNVLVAYVPCKAIVLKKYKEEGEECIYL